MVVFEKFHENEPERDTLKEMLKMIFGLLNAKESENDSCCPYFGSGNTCFGCLSDPPQCTNQEFWGLHHRAVDCLLSVDRNRIMNGKECLLRMLDMIPNHVVTCYNLACAESLLGNVEEALNYLERAIIVGYRDLEYILNDQDFNNIRHYPRFIRIIQKLQEILHPQPIQHLENPLDDKVQSIIDMGFNVPKHIIQDLLIKHNGDVDTVKTFLYN